MKVGHAVGISVGEVGPGKWRLRWRQDERQPDGGVARKQKELFVYSVEERKRLEIEVEAQVVAKGYWEPPSTEHKVKPLDANAERVAEKWLEWKKGPRAARPATLGALTGSAARWFKAVRAVKGLKDTDVVSGKTFSMDTVNQVVVKWREDYAPGTIYQSIAAVVDLWTWAFDQPDYADVIPRPPANRKLVMPTTVAYFAPPDVPTWAEADACLRQIRLPMPRRLATIMRYTGLRLEQAVMVHREDVDLVAGTLLVRKGKSQREQALMRRVPVSPHLLADLRAWLMEQGPGPLFPDLNDPSLPMKSYRNQTRYVTEGWAAATEGGEARKEVWMPINREKARPDHAFRAAFQSNLQEQGVSDGVIDWLVGHAPSSTRGKHYAQPADGALRSAVKMIPAVEWGETNVTVLRFDRRARV
jgi:integrase